MDDMTSILPAVVIAGVVGGGFLASSTLSGETSVTLREAVVCILFIVTIVLYQDRKNNKVSTKVEALGAKMDLNVESLVRGQGEINRTIRHLPCHPLSLSCPKPDVMKLKVLSDIQKLADETKRLAGNIEKEETTTL